MPPTRPLDELPQLVDRAVKQLAIRAESQEEPMDAEVATRVFIHEILPTLVFPKRLFTCLAGDWVGPDAEALFQHIIKAHPELEGELFTRNPGVSADGPPGYTSINDAAGFRIRCSLCGFETGDRGIIANFYPRHAKGCYKEHKNRPAYTCNVGGCGSGWKSVEALAEHLAQRHRPHELVVEEADPQAIERHLRASPRVHPYRELLVYLETREGQRRVAKLLKGALETEVNMHIGEPEAPVRRVAIEAADRDFLLALMTRVGRAVPVRRLVVELIRAHLLAEAPSGERLDELDAIMVKQGHSLEAELARHLRLDPGFREDVGGFRACPQKAMLGPS